MMEFYDKEYIKEHLMCDFAPIVSYPDHGIHVKYPCGREYMYFIWDPEYVFYKCYVFDKYKEKKKIPCYLFPAEYVVLRHEKNKQF